MNWYKVKDIDMVLIQNLCDVSNWVCYHALLKIHSRNKEERLSENEIKYIVEGVRKENLKWTV